MWKYIIVFEDNTVHGTNELSETDYSGAADGILSIIRTEDSKQYWDNDWHDLPDWNKSQG